MDLCLQKLECMHSCLQTDTASVLQEAIEYIKFLHDQVRVRLFTIIFLLSRQPMIIIIFVLKVHHTFMCVFQVLSAPYLKNGHQMQQVKVTKNSLSIACFMFS